MSPDARRLLRAFRHELLLRKLAFGRPGGPGTGHGQPGSVQPQLEDVRPVEADTPFPMALTTSFDQRSPQRFAVTFAESASARRRQTSLARSVTRPCTSPTRNTV